MTETTHVVWQPYRIRREDRERLNGHRGCVVWLTGLSGCGKSTIADAAEAQLHRRGVHTFLLDGDNIRHGLNASPERLQPEYGQELANRFGLGFSELDRQENIRRIAAVAQLLCGAGIVVLAAFVSPYRRDRRAARNYITALGHPHDFLEIFVDAPLDVCEARDPKGLYRLAREGKIPHFTGVSDPYEPPEKPDLVLNSQQHSPDELAARIVELLEQRSIIAANPRS